MLGQLDPGRFVAQAAGCEPGDWPPRCRNVPWSQHGRHGARLGCSRRHLSCVAYCARQNTLHIEGCTRQHGLDRAAVIVIFIYFLLVFFFAKLEKNGAKFTQFVSSYLIFSGIECAGPCCSQQRWQRCYQWPHFRSARFAFCACVLVFTLSVLKKFLWFFACEQVTKRK